MFVRDFLPETLPIAPAFANEAGRLYTRAEALEPLRFALPLILVALPCCSDPAVTGNAVGADAGRDTGAPVAPCTFELGERAATLPAPSFAENVVPIVGHSCTFSSCHFGTATDGALALGPRCEPSAESGQCEYPPDALTPAVLDSIHASLLAPSTRAPSVRRVEPGRPADSFFLLKLADCQDRVSAACRKDCGSEMPPQLPFADQAPDRFEVLVRWVAAGAPR